MMMAKHDWFSPYFARLVQDAARRRRESRFWAALVDRLPPRAGRLRATARHRASTWYHQQLAPRFLAVWEGEEDLEELKAYLGPEFDQQLLWDHVRAVEREEEAAADESTFYRTSRMYLYDLTAFAMTGTKVRYFADLRRLLGARSQPPGLGGAALAATAFRLIGDGHRVAFADFRQSERHVPALALGTARALGPRVRHRVGHHPGWLRRRLFLRRHRARRGPSSAFPGRARAPGPSGRRQLPGADPDDMHLHHLRCRSTPSSTAPRAEGWSTTALSRLLALGCVLGRPGAVRPAGPAEPVATSARPHDPHSLSCRARRGAYRAQMKRPGGRRPGLVGARPSLPTPSGTTIDLAPGVSTPGYVDWRMDARRVLPTT